MQCPKEIARTVYTYFLPSRTAQQDQALAMRTAARDFPAILDLFPDPESSEYAEDARKPPIFLLSAGWRSGSTLLQRLVCSDPSVLVWGEPYDLCHTTDRLMDSLRPFTHEWPRANFFIDAKSGRGLAEQWIANLYPPLESVRRAHRSFFVTLFSDAAKSQGYQRWGLKEVRYGREHIHYLRWLFPGARFVLLVRNPADCWRSYRGKGWFLHWPDQPVRTVRCFARHWARLAGDFLGESKAEDAYLVRYEDLGAPETLEALGRHLDMPVSGDAMNSRIGGGVKPAQRGCRLVARLEGAIIRREAGAVAARLGYAS